MARCSTALTSCLRAACWPAPAPERPPMSERGPLLSTLERLFSGPREAVLTLDEFVSGLEGRSYAFMIAALDVPNCIPTGIPLLSTVTGVPMILLIAQGYRGRPVPRLPRFAGRCG